MTLSQNGKQPLLAVHIIPFDGIGGVETAARTTSDTVSVTHKFRKLYLYSNQPKNSGGLIKGNNRSRQISDQPSAYWNAVCQLRLLRPRLIIASLWRSCVVGIVFKLLYPSTKLVTFLHSSIDAHIADRLINILAMWLSDEIWVDSIATRDARVPRRLLGRTQAISFLLDRHSFRTPRFPGPRFVFWGRIHRDKGLSRAINLFSSIHAKQSNAEFLIIGPDGGERFALEQQTKNQGLDRAVRFCGSMERKEIINAAKGFCFYLQTSKFEGMAMSVVEAMQQGLVPVVTPVGEIGQYCQDGINAIIVSDHETAARRVLELMSDADKFREMAAAAMQTWAQKTLYQEDVMDRCRQLLEK
jgi:glycosyltransferase involved in cell wall biosynthesis